MTFFRIVPLITILLSFAGCAGYQIGPIKPKFMEKVRTIAVPSAKNDTLAPRVEVLVANPVIKQIQQDGTFRIARENDADAILELVLTDIDRNPQRSVRGN